MAPAGMALFHAQGIKTIDVPVFLMAAKFDLNTPLNLQQKPIFEALNPPSYLMVLLYGNHISFSDFCDIMKKIPSNQFENLYGEVCKADYYMPVQKGFELINRYALLFFDFYLKNKVRIQIF